MYKVIFKHRDQAYIYPKLLAAVNQVCNDFGKDVLCVAGYRSLECQKATNASVLATQKNSYQLTNGAVYTGYGKDRKCWASAYGCSNHCFCIAMDMNGWFESLTNAQLKKYGLIKPMEYEPWHVTLVDLVGIPQRQKDDIRDSVLKGADEGMEGNSKIREFQAFVGLEPDGIAGPKTQEAARDVLKVCQKILGNDFKTAEEVIIATQNEPSKWIGIMKPIKYSDSFVMNIVKKMRGE